MSTKQEQPGSQPGAKAVSRCNATQPDAEAHCQHCDMHPVCHPSTLDTAQLETLGQWFPTRRRLKRGEALYEIGEPFNAIYALRRGFFKPLLPSHQQRDQITGFQMTGEILGLDGIGSGFHACQAIALEGSEVCMVPYGSVDELASNLPTLHAHLNKLMSQRIVQDQSTFQVLANLRSESRLAAFLMDLGKRFAALGYSPNSFVLRMTREEIGSYLGLSLETVSRLFSRFQEDGLVDVQTRHLHVTNPEALALIASGKHPH